MGLGACAYCLGGMIAEGSEGGGAVCKWEDEDVWLMMQARNADIKMKKENRRAKTY